MNIPSPLQLRHTFLKWCLPLAMAWLCCLLFLVKADGAALALIRQCDNPSKILRMESEHTVTIDGIIYKLPLSWRGKKQIARKFVYEDFARIPPKGSWNESRLYLLKEAQAALVILLDKAKEENISLIVHSAYRSTNYQKRIFTKMIEEGRNFDDIIRYVAPPGYSEHMLGTVVDFYPSNWNFANLDAYRWLRENGHLYGFFETYPEERVDGEPWEPWHWRYFPERQETTSLQSDKEAMMP